MTTIERQVLQKHYSSLHTGLQYSVDDILPLMKHHSLLPEAVIMNASSSGMLATDKLTLILNALETQIGMDGQAFHTFLDKVLAKKSHLSKLYHQMSFSYRHILRSQEKSPATADWPAPTDQSEYPTCSKSELETNTGTFTDRDSGISTQRSGLQEYIDANVTAQVRTNCQSTNAPDLSLHSLPVTSSRPNDLPMIEKDIPSPLGSSTVHTNPARTKLGPSTPFSKEEIGDPEPGECLSSQSSVTSSCMGCDDMQAKMKEMEREMARMTLKLHQQESVIAVADQHYLQKVEEIQELKEKLTEKQKERHKLKKDLKQMQARYKQLEGHYHLAMEQVKEVESLKRKLEKTEREKAFLWEEFLKKCNDTATYGCSRKECMQQKHQLNLCLFQEREEKQELYKKVQALSSRVEELENALRLNSPQTSS